MNPFYQKIQDSSDVKKRTEKGGQESLPDQSP
jgi:hypothetical protein